MAALTHEIRSAAGKKGRGIISGLEAAASEALVADGFKVYAPYAVCDRIAVKDGRVYFIEFKREGQSLRPAQQEIHDLTPDNYLIRYYAPEAQSDVRPPSKR